MNTDYIITEFKKQYGYLEKFGLEINGIGDLMDEPLISISTPFIFDRRKLPSTFMGLSLRDGTKEEELPVEFQNIKRGKEYIWAYQRFEDFVDKHSEEIQKKLETYLTRDEMLDALCFGNFKIHKESCIKWEKEGKIPKWEKE
jgi:hypothetical protein